jgi:signal peptidase
MHMFRTKGNLRRRSTRIGSGVAGSLLLAFVVTVAVTMLLPPLAGYDRYLVEGGSMSPTIPRGSIVLERRVAIAELEKNDVITYTRPGASTPVTHRIVSTDRDRLGRRIFWTKGDANARPDPRPVHLDSAQQPRVSFHVPHAGWILIALENPGLRLIVLGALAFGIVAVTLVALWREGDRALAAAGHEA